MYQNHVDQNIFNSTVHDIKNVLTGIVGISDMVVDQKSGFNFKSDEVIDVVKTINSSSSNLLIFLEEILSIHNHGLQLATNKYNVEDIVKKSIQIAQASLLLKNVKLVREIEENLPQIEVARIKLIQILVNLIDNAVKYSDNKAKIILYARTSGDFVDLGVKDFGSGITAERLKEIAESDQRSISKDIDQTHSFGLGLMSVKQIVELYHGRMIIESQIGQGTNVCLRFLK